MDAILNPIFAELNRNPAAIVFLFKSVAVVGIMGLVVLTAALPSPRVMVATVMRPVARLLLRLLPE